MVCLVMRRWSVVLLAAAVFGQAPPVPSGVAAVSRRRTSTRTLGAGGSGTLGVTLIFIP